MALINYSIQLSTTPVNSGPLYDVFYSSDCTTYIAAGQVQLPDTSAIGLVEIDDTFTCIKLQSSGNCFNNVVSGSSPSTSFYNTKLVELIYKGTTGPSYDMGYSNNGTAFTPMYPIVLDNIGSTQSVEFPSGSVAMRLTAGEPCNTEVERAFIPQPTPTATAIPPTPTATSIVSTPTPSATAVAVPTPTPTPTATGVIVTPTPTPVPSTFYARFVTCDDPNGLILQVQSSSVIDTSLIFSSNSECFSFLGPGGTGVNGDISTFTEYSSCSTCYQGIPVTPTATPQPTPQCNSDSISVSLISAVDAYCNLLYRIVYHNGSTFANATEIYSSTDCSSLSPGGRYYSDGVNTWYWSGASKILISNPSCP